MATQNLKQYLSELLLEYETFKEYSRLDTSYECFVKQYIKKYGNPILDKEAAQCNHIGSDGIIRVIFNMETGKEYCKICGKEIKYLQKSQPEKQTKINHKEFNAGVRLLNISLTTSETKKIIKLFELFQKNHTLL